MRTSLSQVIGPIGLAVRLAVTGLAFLTSCTGFDPSGGDLPPDPPPDASEDASPDLSIDAAQPDASPQPDGAPVDASPPVDDDAGPMVDASPPGDGPVAPCMSDPSYDTEDPATGHRYWRYFSMSLPLITWSEAVARCEVDGAHLVVIDSADENELIVDIGFGFNRAWIGLGDAATEGTYEWVTGAPLSYENWGTGEPTGFNDSHDCVDMDSDGEWGDGICGGFTLRDFVCECDPDYIP